MNSRICQEPSSVVVVKKIWQSFSVSCFALNNARFGSFEEVNLFLKHFAEPLSVRIIFFVALGPSFGRFRGVTEVYDLPVLAILVDVQYDFSLGQLFRFQVVGQILFLEVYSDLLRVRSLFGWYKLLSQVALAH